MKLWQAALAALVVFGAIVWGITMLMGDSRAEYNKCRDGGGTVGFCLTGFK